jgi:WD40 repeat protein
MDDPGRHTNATLLVAREGNVFSILFSPDDKRLATLSWSHTVRLWDTTSGADIAGPMKHDNVNYSMPSEMAFSFDSSMLTVGYSCGSVALWDGQTGGIKGLGHRSHGNRVSLLSFFHSNTMMASASPVERNILLWDVSSGSLVHTGGRLIHDKNVSCFSVSFDGNYIASGSGDRIVTLWKVETQEQVCQMHAREALHIRSILYIPPGNMFVTASEVGTLQCWEGTSGKSKQLIKAGTSANNANVPVSFSLNGQYIASIFDRISLWQKSGGTFVEIELHDAHLGGRIISFSPDSSRLASILDAGRMRIWSTTSGEVMQTVDFAQAHSFSRCAIAHALGKFAAAHGDGIIRLYEIATQGLSNQHSTTFNPAGSLKCPQTSSYYSQRPKIAPCNSGV